MSIANTYIQYGVPSNWAAQYELIGISSVTFKVTSNKNLIDKYKIPEDQVDFVKDCLTRQPIDPNIVQKLLEKNNFVCCLCKESKNNGYIIHHIKEYSKTQDNSYPNLAVLCPNHHDLAHRTGTNLTQKISSKQIIAAKKSWEQQVIKTNKQKAVKKITIPNDWKKINPYKELQSYTETDKEYFFGRNEEIKELLEKIIKYKIVGLFGESGTGKTSVVNAGLIPNLKNEAYITISIRCLDEPIKRIRENLFATLKEKNITNNYIEELAATVSFPHLIIQLNKLLSKENLNLIIIVDQFEEIFTRAREPEREQLSKGITESLIASASRGKIYFLLSLREDYLGDLWDWSHKYSLEDAWIHQYRIKRFSEEKAYQVIVEPLNKLYIKHDNKFVNKLVSELKKIGDGLIYPPYLQIACSVLFEIYKNQNTTAKPTIIFGENLYLGSDTAESIIADYLSDSMLEELIESEKLYAQNILDLLTGAEGLRAFLTIDEISRYTGIQKSDAQHVIEHLIKKKIVHPVVEKDIITGYELVHDFLSKKFFENLKPEAKRNKLTLEIFRRAFKEWTLHDVLASKDRLEILFANHDQLRPNSEEWLFLIKSSFFVYWPSENKWIPLVEREELKKICLGLLNDKEEKIIERSIETLGKIYDQEIIKILIGIIESKDSTDVVKESALRTFWFDIKDKQILEPLKRVLKDSKNHRLRKSAVYGFATTLKYLSENGSPEILKDELKIIQNALNDSMTLVRKEAADTLSYRLVSNTSVVPLIERLKVESSISSKKAIVSALGSLYRKGESKKLIFPILQTIAADEKEDYRIREEARFIL